MAEQNDTRGVGPQFSPPQQVEKKLSHDEAQKELQDAISGSNQVLVNRTTLFPIFPDTIVVDRAKFTITRRNFIRSAEVMSMRIEDILNVTATVGPLLGNVRILSRVMNAEKPFMIGPFWRKEAEHIKRVTQGYVIALQRGIDCSSLPTPELVAMLDQLGHDDIEPANA